MPFQAQRVANIPVDSTQDALLSSIMGAEAPHGPARLDPYLRLHAG